MKKSTFYLDNFCIIKDSKDFDLKNFNEIKRRLATVDKAAISALDKVFNPDIEEIVFASKFGELERLDKIIEEYEEMNEVSPMKFSGSVHNYSVGCFNLIKKLDTPYFCVSSGDNSISAGLCQAVSSKANRVLFCYSDVFEGEIKAFACLISKDGGKKKFELEIKENKRKCAEFEAFCDLISGKKEEFNSDFVFVKES